MAVSNRLAERPDIASIRIRYELMSKLKIAGMTLEQVCPELNQAEQEDLQNQILGELPADIEFLTLIVEKLDAVIR